MNDDGDDPLTSFYSHQYQDEIINRNYDQLLALADSIHDFGKGYRNIPLSSGVNEATRFLRNGVIGESGWDILKTGYNNIEATNRSFFETEANISWVGPIQTKLSFEELNIEKAKELRSNYTSIEIEPASTTIKALAEPGNKAGAMLLENVRDFIITFLFGEPNSECYFASDADAKQVKKILSSSTTAAGIIFPQTLADSAITSLGKSLTQKPDEYYFPCDEQGGREFTSSSNNFTAKYGCRIKYINGDESDTNRFSFSTPYAWKQQIEFGGAGASIVLGPSTGVEGPSVDQLLQLQVKTRSSPTTPTVKSSKASQIELYKFIDDIYSSIRSGITALPPTHSLYMDIKRGGDQDQCLAVKYARRDKGFVALITGDITCAIKNRCYDNPTIEHYNDRIRLYRSSVSERILGNHEILKLQYTRYSSELKKLEPIINYFIAESKPLSMSALIDPLPASEKKDDLAVYLNPIDEVILSSTGYVPFSFEDDIDTLLEGKTPDEQASLLSEQLDSILSNITRARELVNQIIELTSVADTPLKTIEFLSWLILQDAPLDPAVAYPEIRYDPENVKPAKPILASATPYNIIQTIDNYNKKIIAYYNSFFNKRVSDNLLNENSITFKGDNTAIERVRGLLLRIYQISVNKKTLRDLYISTPAAIIAIWEAALNAFLVYIDNATNASGILLGTQLDNFIRTFMATEKNEAVKNFIIGDDRPVADKSVTATRRETAARMGRLAGEKMEGQKGFIPTGKAKEKVAEKAVETKYAMRQRKRIMSQRGGAACVTKVDIREELYDFFGIIAADFRTVLFEAYPELSLYIRIQDATPAQFLELRELYQKISGTNATTTVNSNDDLRAAVASLDLAKYDIPEIYDAVSGLVQNSDKYIELFNSIVVSKFQEEGGYADDALCNNHKELIANISNQLSELDAEKVMLLSLVYEIMTKNESVTSYFKLVRPELFSINIDVLSDEGVRKLSVLINTLNSVANLRIPVATVSLLRGGGRLRKTHRRYSQRHYKRRKRTGKR